jgi:hypothetical protein
MTSEPTHSTQHKLADQRTPDTLKSDERVADIPHQPFSAKKLNAAPNANDSSLNHFRSHERPVDTVLIRQAIEHPSAKILTPEIVIQLQRLHGNQFVNQLVEKSHQTAQADRKKDSLEVEGSTLDAEAIQRMGNNNLQPIQGNDLLIVNNIIGQLSLGSLLPANFPIVYSSHNNGGNGRLELAQATFNLPAAERDWVIGHELSHLVQRQSWLIYGMGLFKGSMTFYNVFMYLLPIFGEGFLATTLGTVLGISGGAVAGLAAGLFTMGVTSWVTEALADIQGAVSTNAGGGITHMNDAIQDAPDELGYIPYIEDTVFNLLWHPPSIIRRLFLQGLQAMGY